MSGMLEAYLDFLVAQASAEITHIGMVDETETEVTGGSYARQAVTWADEGMGLMRPNSNLNFNIPANTTVRGWRGFSAITDGTNYGGEDFETPEHFDNAGVAILNAATTGIQHIAVPIDS